MNSTNVSPTAPRIAVSLDGTLDCSSCNTQNRPHRQFCAHCGTRLWEPCVCCGQRNTAGEKHCGGCGDRLADQVESLREKLKSKLHEIDGIAEDSRYQEAIDQLSALSGQLPDHTQLAGLRHEIERRVSSFRAEQGRCKNECEAAMARGRELLAKFDYEQAAIALEGVSEPYQTEELRALIDKVRTRQIEVLTLVAEIRRAIAAKRTAGLLPKVEELLRLKPDHAQARSLVEKLRPLERNKKLAQRDTLIREAKKLLACHDYAAAVEKLRQIDAELRTPRLCEMIDDTHAKAEESAWLERDLREAVIYDEHVPVIAERLVKLRPNDAEVSELARRIRSSSGGKARGVLKWPIPPASSIWGPPLETISAFRRIDVSALDASSFEADRYSVAAGLALQGLDQSFWSVNLVPPEKQGLLGFVKPRRKPKAAWGIDVGRAGLRAIRLSLRGDEPQVAAETIEQVEHASPLGAPGVDANAVLAESLEKLLAKIDQRNSRLCVGLPAHKTLFRAVELPLVDEAKLAELMTFEVRRQIPFPLETVVWEYQALGNRATELRSVRECCVALLAMKLDQAQAALAPFKDHSLKVDVLTSNAAALLNFVMFDQALVPSGEHGIDDVTLILDVGADASNLVLATRQALWTRSLPLAGNALTRALSKELQVTFTQAEKLKQRPTAAPQLHRLYAALEPHFSQLSRELARSIDCFLKADARRQLTRMIATGGGLRLHGALRRLWHDL